MSEPVRLTQFSKGGGCGCKIAPSVLQQILHTDQKDPFEKLLVGNEQNDDAAVYLLDDDNAVISTADFFLPIVDDAFDFGRIAAANAISDVYAMGGSPLMAVAILGWPVDSLPVSEAQKVLEGARAVCREAGIPLAGGHTIDSRDPVFGLAVTGRVALQHLKQNNKAKEGDLLFLTKELGSGILATAVKRALIQPEHYTLLIEQMTTLNKAGEKFGREPGVHAMTDVTGFGLLGHLVEMAEGSGLTAVLEYRHLQKMEGLNHYLAQKTIPDATFRNWNSYSSKVKFEKGVDVMEAFNLLPDPQTNGGLLVAVDPESVADFTKLLESEGLGRFTQPIGYFTTASEKTILVQ